MLAVDTNIVVRYLVRDDTVQATRAAALIRENQVWIAKTVLLEAEWILRSVYHYSPARVTEALRVIVGLPTVLVEDALAVAKALDWSEEGLDFADALHLASAGAADGFATFDRELAKQAKPLSPLKLILP